jgi:hypothetical protein
VGSRRRRKPSRARQEGHLPPPEAALAPEQPRSGFSLVRVSRDLAFDPPLTGRVKRISSAIHAELSRHGCATRQPTPSTLAFDGPTPWSFPPSLTRLSATMVERGTVTLLPAEGTIRLDLRFDVVRTYIWPAIFLYIFGWNTPRGFALASTAVIAALWVPRYAIARHLFVTWVREAALRGEAEA